MANRSKTLQLLFAILLFFFVRYVLGEEVWIIDGRIEGTNLTTRKGKTIEAFLGIPYAIPPLGWRRFRAPVEIEPWDDILVANTDRPQCPQLEDDVVVGDEDCLYLNVYTPQIATMETKRLLPTMVYFHGGKFVRGNASSTMYGPEYLLDKDIVLVTVQYRLGALGFLTTNDLTAPGNFGLKDQVLALKWVRKNILFFGGDQKEVTIFGQDAGGVSAQLHSISDSSAGLFHRYISQSGTSLCLWAYVLPSYGKEDAVRLGKHLNCPTANSKALVDCLRQKELKSLVDSNDIFSDKTNRIKTWGPTEEPEHPGAFLTMFPYYKVTTDGTHVSTSMVGHVADEGLMLTAPYYWDSDAYEKVANNLGAFIKEILNVLYIDDSIPEKYVKQTEKYYFNGTKADDKEAFIKNMTNFVSDTFFFEPADLMAQTMIDTSGNTIFFYSFDYRGTFSETSRVNGSNENIGVTHGDDLLCLFPGTQNYSRSESDEEMIDTMIDLWTSFAETGIPSTKRFPEANFWKPYGDNRDYLKIGDNSKTSLSGHDKFDADRLLFLSLQSFDVHVGSYYRNVYGIQ